jgi:hypothetical protein
MIDAMPARQISFGEIAGAWADAIPVVKKIPKIRSGSRIIIHPILVTKG